MYVFSVFVKDFLPCPVPSELSQDLGVLDVPPLKGPQIKTEYTRFGPRSLWTFNLCRRLFCSGFMSDDIVPRGRDVKMFVWSHFKIFWFTTGTSGRAPRA